MGIVEGPTFNGHTYTTAPVQAKLGPHRFNFPANYYDDQIGPYVDGGVGITLIWPEMKPGGMIALPVVVGVLIDG